MNINIERIFLVISLIFMVIMYTEINNLKKKNLEKINLENFNNNDIVEHMTITEDTKKEIKELIHTEYNYDLEAIRNLGAISKSLLTGKNYHSNDVSLSSVAYTSTAGVLCNSTSNIGNAATEEQAKTSCNNDATCAGFTKNSDGTFTLYSSIDGTTGVGATVENSCSLKQSITGTLENNNLIIPANLQVLGWAVAVPVGAMIMWSRSDMPPSPNTVPYNGENDYSDKSNTWYPCIGGDPINGVTIPNFRGRIPVGHGSTDGNLGPTHAHNFPTILQQTEGLMPVANHKHTATTTVATANAAHSHRINWEKDGYGGGNHIGGSDHPTADKTTNTNSANATHAHTASTTISDPHTTAADSKTRGTHFSRHNIPHATVIQFWIRVR